MDMPLGRCMGCIGMVVNIETESPLPHVEWRQYDIANACSSSTNTVTWYRTLALTGGSLSQLVGTGDGWFTVVAVVCGKLLSVLILPHLSDASSS